MVRRLLRRYHLLEMPEEWNQAVFDHHVHDANTKGRKNPTHLIMDAWIKGIRSLTVVYYNYVDPGAARELMSAAEIMGITLRIGLLFHAPFRGRLANFIWIPRGFSDPQGFLDFLAEPPVRRLMDEGRQAARWLEARVLRMLDRWNERDRPALADELGAEPAPLNRDEFLAFVGAGGLSPAPGRVHPPSAHAPSDPAAAELAAALNDLAPQAPERRELRARLLRLDDMTAEAIPRTSWRSSGRYPEILDFRAVSTDPDCPEILRLRPLPLLERLTACTAATASSSTWPVSRPKTC